MTESWLSEICSTSAKSSFIVGGIWYYYVSFCFGGKLKTSWHPFPPVWYYNPALKNHHFSVFNISGEMTQFLICRNQCQCMKVPPLQAENERKQAWWRQHRDSSGNQIHQQWALDRTRDLHAEHLLFWGWWGSMRDFSSPTRAQTHTPCMGCSVWGTSTGLPRKSPIRSILIMCLP